MRWPRLLCFCFVLYSWCAFAQGKIQVYGHRGARAVRPENTIPAFEYAIAAGVDALELDMAVTEDSFLVISHDPILKPPVCTGPSEAPIHSLRLAELAKWDCGAMRNPAFPKQEPAPGTRMPTLDAVFALASRGKFDFDIETKIFLDKPQLAPDPEEFARLVLAAVRKHHLERRVILQSFDFRTLRAMKRLAPEIRLAALYEGSSPDLVAVAQSAGAGIISPHYRLVTPRNVQAAHDRNLTVVPWTANSPADWDRLMAARVDAIITDDPAALIAHLKAKGLR
jgi:glycerophosphoryl diester phosphodiesterase